MRNWCETADSVEPMVIARSRTQRGWRINAYRIFAGLTWDRASKAWTTSATISSSGSAACASSTALESIAMSSFATRAQYMNVRAYAQTTPLCDNRMCRECGFRPLVRPLTKLWHRSPRPFGAGARGRGLIRQPAPQDVHVHARQPPDHLTRRISRPPSCLPPMAQDRLRRQRLMDVVDQRRCHRPPMQMDELAAQLMRQRGQ